MITLQDIFNYYPYCKVRVVNIMDYDVVDMMNNADRYMITDVDVFQNALNVVVKREK